MEFHKKSNRLVNEKSPYLLQHAYNPVDWYPWGDEAFEKARVENKPIFLSIGYSTCYWCHVMEREVFENEDIADLMNEKLVSVKVDREERPDVDRIYMTFLQATTGQGGWPMSVFLTPDLKPFFAGTYMRPAAHNGRPGFPDLVSRISEIWENEKEKIIASSDQIIAQLIQKFEKSGGIIPGNTILTEGYNLFLHAYDTVNGGFGTAPKFPRPSVFNFLLRYFKLTGNGSSLKIVLNTLRAMARGGIFDHIGGGFHRYSVDNLWHLPHFEKMLYDQAQLAVSYIEAYQITKDEEFIRVAEEVLNYVLAKLHHEKGGFYSAEDAESAADHLNPDEKDEGAFYVWTKEEIESCLDNEQAQIFGYYFGIGDEGNVIQNHGNNFIGKNILHIAHGHDETAEKFGKNPEEVRRILSSARDKLFSEREKRPNPHLDDKIITAWNGLMISAFSKGYQVTGRDAYLDAAKSAAEFIFENLYDKKSHALLRRYRNGDARFSGSLQDYTFFVQSLLDLYEASFETRWLENAIELTERQIHLFRDAEGGGFFDTPEGDSSLIFRMKDDYDGAEPAGNSIAALNLIRLSLMINREGWRGLAGSTIASMGNRLGRMPDAIPQMLAAIHRYITPPKEIIIAGSRSGTDTKRILREIGKRFLPDKTVLLVDDDSKDMLNSRLPFTREMVMIDGKATVYFCENYTCKLPTNDIEKITESLG